jgi:four helix bundle protein
MKVKKTGNYVGFPNGKRFYQIYIQPKSFMFLNLKHESLEVYKIARRLVIEVYKTSKNWPPEEKYGLKGQVRRAANSVKFNIAEGSSRKSNKDRCRFYEIARGSIVEIDSAYESAADLKYSTMDELKDLGPLIKSCFAMLSNLIASTQPK